MTQKQITKDIPGHWLLSITEARLFLNVAYGIKYSDQVMRRYARDSVMPFFKLNPTSTTAKYHIQADDIRKHIMQQRTKAVNRSAA